MSNDFCCGLNICNDLIHILICHARQIYFVNQIVEYIVHNGMMKDLSVLQEAPFTDRGSIVEVFTDISVWMGIKKLSIR